MLNIRQYTWGRWASLALVAICSLGLPSQVLGQTENRSSGGAGAALSVVDAPLIDWSHAMRVQRLAEQWLKQDPALEMRGSHDITVSGLWALRITLRMGGEPLAIGDYYVPVDERGRPVDLIDAARTAMQTAIVQASNELVERHQRAMRDLPADQQRPPLTVRDVATTTLIGVQLAGLPERVTVAADAPADAVLDAWEPGFHGLRLSTQLADGRERSAVFWPVTAIASNVQPTSQIRRLLASVQTGLPEIDTVARAGGPRLERFEVIHAVKPTMLQPTQRLVRGNRPLQPLPLDSRTLESLSYRMTDFMLERVRKNGTLLGTYFPTSSRVDHDSASLEDSALAAYALTQRLNLLGPDRPNAELAPLRAYVEAVVDALLLELVPDNKPVHGPASALAIMAILDAPHLADRRIERDELVRRLLQTQGEDGQFRAGVAPSTPVLEAEDQALIVAALAKLASHRPSPETISALQRARTEQWFDPQPGRSPEAWYWLAQAELSMSPAVRQQVALPKLEERRIRFMQDLAVTWRSRQVREPTEADLTDVIGGYVEPGERMPDWRSAWPAGYQATILRDSQVVQANETLPGVLSAALGGRFLAQLMFDEPSCFYVRHVDEVLGGVRASLVDNRLSIRYTAAALLAATDLQLTLNSMESRSRADDQEAGEGPGS